MELKEILLEILEEIRINNHLLTQIVMIESEEKIIEEVEGNGSGYLDQM